MKRIAIFLVTALLGLAGCGGLGKGEDSKSSPAPVPAPTPLLTPHSEALKAVLREGDTPQAFSVALTWTTESDKVSLYRESASRPRHVLGSYDRSVKEFIDVDLPLGETVTYWLNEETDLGRLSKVQIPVPRDMEVTGRVVTRRIAGVHRLFLRKGAEVVAADGQLEIVVDQIFSDEATLRSFAPESFASLGNPGRAGDYLVVRARRGAGILNVVGHGQQGGQGVPGLEGAPGAVGRPGLPATLACLLTEKLAENAPPIFFALDNEFVKQITVGQPPGAEAWQLFKCYTAPTDGGVGGAGGKGGKGSNGARGGDAGNILVQVTNPGGLKVFPRSLGGGGGLAGRGGPGGKGGAPGEAGKRDGGDLCAAAKPGTVGPMGPEGEPGEPGPAGQAGVVCLKLGSATFGDCDRIPFSAPYFP